MITAASIAASSHLPCRGLELLIPMRKIYPLHASVHGVFFLRIRDRLFLGYSLSKVWARTPPGDARSKVLELADMAVGMGGVDAVGYTTLIGMMPVEGGERACVERGRAVLSAMEVRGLKPVLATASVFACALLRASRSPSGIASTRRAVPSGDVTAQQSPSSSSSSSSSSSYLSSARSGGRMKHVRFCSPPPAAFSRGLLGEEEELGRGRERCFDGRYVLDAMEALWMRPDVDVHRAILSCELRMGGAGSCLRARRVISRMIRDGHAVSRPSLIALMASCESLQEGYEALRLASSSLASPSQERAYLFTALVRNVCSRWKLRYGPASFK